MADSADLVVLGAYYGTGSKGDCSTGQIRTTDSCHENSHAMIDAVKQCDCAALPPSCTTTRECCIMQCDVRNTAYICFASRRGSVA